MVLPSAWPRFLLFGTVLLVVSSSLTAAAPPFEGVLVGAVSKGDAWAIGREDLRGDVVIYHCPVGSGTGSAGEGCSISSFDPCRWHLRFGAFWVQFSFSGVGWNDMRDRIHGLQRFELADLRKGRLIPAPGAREVSMIPHYFTNGEPVDDTRLLSRFVHFQDPVCYYDAVPIGPTAALQFVLTNVGGRLVPRGYAGAISGAVVEMRGREEKQPQWSLKAFEYRPKWDPKEQRWEHEAWQTAGQVEVRFREAFHGFVRGTDYYFSTIR